MPHIEPSIHTWCNSCSQKLDTYSFLEVERWVTFHESNWWEHPLKEKHCLYTTGLLKKKNKKTTHSYSTDSTPSLLAVVQNVKKDREMCWKKSQGHEQFLSLRTQLPVVVNDSKWMLGKDFLWNLENSTPFYNTQSQGSFLKQQQPKYLLHIYFKTKQQQTLNTQ